MWLIIRIVRVQVLSVLVPVCVLALVLCVVGLTLLSLLSLKSLSLVSLSLSCVSSKRCSLWATFGESVGWRRDGDEFFRLDTGDVIHARQIVNLLK